MSEIKLQSWPFKEAKRILKIRKKQISEKNKVVLETGYGPSGLPHIGTFGEVERTIMVSNSLRYLEPELVVELIVFVDDMDGMRRVPSNLPNQEMLEKYINIPLCNIPDPFGVCDDLASYMLKKLCAFLDGFDYNYKLMRASDCYKTGMFNNLLYKVLEKHQDILDIIIPTLGEERSATYSPILPISQKSGEILQVKIEKIDVENKLIYYKDNESGELISVVVDGGNCKLQWKADWGMRWAELGVDYEMHGKDLESSAVLASKICRVLGFNPPVLYQYEMFLDEEGKKISKSKGNGLSMEDWIFYAPQESLSYYMYHAPNKAKKLSFSVIPKYTDEYIKAIYSYPDLSEEKKLNSPLYHIHNNKVPQPDQNFISFTELITLASACGTHSEEVLWKFILKRYPDVTPENSSLTYSLLKYAIKYYHNFVEPLKKNYEFEEKENDFLKAFRSRLVSVASSDELSEGVIQKIAFDLGKEFFDGDFKLCFSILYKALLRTEEGPKIGSFVMLYGVKNAITLIDKNLSTDN